MPAVTLPYSGARSGVQFAGQRTAFGVPIGQSYHEQAFRGALGDLGGMLNETPTSFTDYLSQLPPAEVIPDVPADLYSAVPEGALQAQIAGVWDQNMMAAAQRARNARSTGMGFSANSPFALEQGLSARQLGTALARQGQGRMTIDAATANAQQALAAQNLQNQIYGLRVQQNVARPETVARLMQADASRLGPIASALSQLARPFPYSRSVSGTNAVIY